MVRLETASIFLLLKLLGNEFEADCVMETGRLSDQGTFESFGLGSLLIFALLYSDVRVFDYIQSYSYAFDGVLPAGIGVALGGALVFLLYALGRAAISLGSSFSGLTTYKTITRYSDYHDASVVCSERDWLLFSNLRKELRFVDGVLGVILIAIAAVTLKVINGDFPQSLMLLILLAVSGTVGCLNTAWQIRIRTKFLLHTAQLTMPSKNKS